ncbi:MAG TPA: acyltransferase, partial [Flavobacteriaceae bacterium]|nr:acyltransferase [Flavobacteriaceae bacterium]
MIKKIKFLSTAIYHRMISKNKLAKLLGVSFGKECHFMTRGWGSEPYLISMGDNVKTSSGVNFITHDGSVYVIREKYPEFNQVDIFGEITIGSNVFIGINATILPNTKIGDNVVIGACSLVKGILKENSVYAGIPAKYICSIEDFHKKNNYDNTGNYTPKEKRSYLLSKYRNLKKGK